MVDRRQDNGAETIRLQTNRRLPGRRVDGRQPVQLGRLQNRSIVAENGTIPAVKSTHQWLNGKFLNLELFWKRSYCIN